MAVGADAHIRPLQKDFALHPLDVRRDIPPGVSVCVLL